tara:strand:+ start:343 stop:771 length:429 start_codon:yes stop_codon:yes gene_type:complete
MPRVSRRRSKGRSSVRRGRSSVRRGRGSARRGSRGRSARRVRTASGGGDCDEMKDRITKHDALRQNSDLRERVVDRFLEDTGIKDLLVGAINDFVTEDQSAATDDAFYCRETTTIRLLKTKFNTLSNEMNVDMLLKNTLNSL